MERDPGSEIGVETGGSNIQYAVNPANGRMVVIEMNPRVSRSSALASKATGFPIAKIAAKLAVGYTLDEIPNDITKKTPACFEPTIDYVVAKIPKWQFEKFSGADEGLGPQMKSVGEAMAIGRTFKEALMKGIRSLETGKKVGAEKIEPRILTQRLVTPHPEWGFPGLKPGDKWCVCVTRWKSALYHNRAAPVDLEATHASALEFVTLEELKAHALN